MKKICTKCNMEKNIVLFKIDIRNRDGRGAFCKACHVQATLNLRKTDPIKYKLKSRVYNSSTKKRTYLKKYKTKNRKIYSQYQLKRSRHILYGTPKWLTEEQLKEMKYLYVLAKELSWLSEDKLVVDHIMPILGKNSCGLHVPWNLQIIPAKFNRYKSNRAEGWVAL